ncbi:MAG: hypothetical protein U0325_04510 [Polyangiales bacterium]
MSRAEKVQRLEAMLVRVLARKDITRIRPQGAPTGPAARPAPAKPSALEARMGPAMDRGGDDLSEVPTSVIRGQAAAAAAAADVVAAPEPSFRIEGRARTPVPSSAPRAPDAVVAEVAPSIPAPPAVAEVAPSIPAPPVAPSIPAPPVVAEVAPSIPAPPVVEIAASIPAPPVVAEAAPSIPAPPVVVEAAPSIPAPPVVADLSLDKATPVPGASDLELSEGPEIELSFDEPAPAAEPVAAAPVMREAPVAVVETVAAVPETEPALELLPVAAAATAAVALAVEPAPTLELDTPEGRISTVEIEPEELELPVPEAPPVLRTPPPLPPSRPPPDALAEVEIERDPTPEVQRIRESIPVPVEPESLKPPRDPSTAPVAAEALRAESFSPAPLPPLPGFVSVVPPVAAERPKTLRGMLDRALSLRPRR